MVDLLDADVRGATRPLRPAIPVTAPRPARSAGHAVVVPLALDLGLPLVAYYVARDVFGTTMIAAFVASGCTSLVGMVTTLARKRRLSSLSALVLGVNIAGIMLTFVGGGVRVVAAKDAVISSVVGFGILWSVLRGRPALADVLRPFVTHGGAAREAAWDRLATASPFFRRLVGTHSAIMGAAFVLDCVVRVVCAAIAPLSVLGWIGTAASVGALVVGALVSGAVCGAPLGRLVTDEMCGMPTWAAATQP